MKILHFTFFAGLILAAARTSAADLAVTGNLTVTGTIGAVGKIDSADNTFLFGTQGGLDAVSLAYVDNTTDTLQTLINRNPASWLWVHKNVALTANVPAMRLDSAHQLILYNAAGTTAGVTLTPASNRITLGTANLTGSGTALTAGGAMTVTGALTASAGITNTNGSLTGGATGLSLTAGGTNQNITLTPSGTGSTILNGNVGIGVTPSGSYRLEVLGIPKFFPAAGGNNYVLLGAGGQSTGGSGVVLGYNQTYNGTAMTNSAYLQAESQGVAYRNLLLNPLGGNVGIGTTTPTALLDIVRNNTSQSGLAVRNTVGGVSLFTDNGYSGLFQSANIPLIFYTNSAERLRVDGSGSVGIGKTPSLALDVNGPVRSTSGSIDVRLQAGAAGAAGVGSFSNDPLLLLTAGTEKMRVTTAGDVGIGTTSPAGKLDVNGSLIHDGNYTHNLSHGGFNATILPANRNGASTGEAGLYSWVSEPGATWTGAGIARNMRNSAGNFPRVNTGLTGQMMRFDEGTGIWFSTENAGGTRYNPMYLSGNDMIVNGSVGIGTSPGSRKLNVQTTDATNDVGVEIGIGRTTGTNYGLAATAYGSGAGLNQGIITTARDGASNFGLRIYNVLATANNYALYSDSAAQSYFQGNVGIGTTAPTHKLSVKGTIRAQEIIVDNTNWADYVFDESYALAPLSDVEAHIKAKKHLPGIPSAAEIAEHGVSMGDMQSKLLSKIEELTLHMIAQQKEIAALRQQVGELKAATQP